MLTFVSQSDQIRVYRLLLGQLPDSIQTNGAVQVGMQLDLWDLGAVSQLFLRESDVDLS